MRNCVAYALLLYICLLVSYLFHVQRFALESQSPLDLHAHHTNFQINSRRWFLKPLWSRLGGSRRNWRQVRETGSCLRISEIGFVILFFCVYANDLWSASIHLRWVAKWWKVMSACVQIWARSRSKVHVSHHSPCKSAQVAGETSSFDQGFKGLCTSRLLCSNHSAIMN